jgi:polyisoprenoid-binding protein YceI
MTTTAHPFTGTYSADPVHSTFTFAVTHMAVSRFRASFDEVSATVATGADGDITVTGEVAAESLTIRTPDAFRQHVLYGEDFLDAKQHPTITFRSTRVELAPDGTATVDADLTVKGITRAVRLTGGYTAPVEDPYGHRRGGVSLSGTVDRRDLGISFAATLPGGGDVVGTEVALSAEIELVEAAG